MAVQAQMYPDTCGFPMFITPEWAGGGGAVDDMQLNLQRQQFQVSHTQFPKNTQFLNHNETPSFSLSQIELQSLDIDNFIIYQNERLRHVLREKLNRDITELLKKLESRTAILLNKKDEEITKAKTRTFQLESLLLKLQTDCLTWQQLAKQNEVHVISLTNTIQQLREPLVEDTESCCDEQEHESGMTTKMVCRVCEKKEVGVVVLPCRHLCLCSVCDTMIDLCPVCRTVKKGSVEVLFC